jgi:hypothetical protein
LDSSDTRHYVLVASLYLGKRGLLDYEWLEQTHETWAFTLWERRAREIGPTTATHRTLARLRLRGPEVADVLRNVEVICEKCQRKLDKKR